MLELVVAMLLQAADPQAAAQTTDTQVTITANAPETKAEEPKVVCKMVAVTGSRTQKERVCKSPRTAEGEREELKQMIDRAIVTSQPRPTG